VERDRFAGHIDARADARADARLGGVRSKDYQLAIWTFQKRTGVRILKPFALDHDQLVLPTGLTETNSTDSRN